MTELRSSKLLRTTVPILLILDNLPNIVDFGFRLIPIIRVVLVPVQLLRNGLVLFIFLLLTFLILSRPLLYLISIHLGRLHLLIVQ